MKQIMSFVVVRHNYNDIRFRAINFLAPKQKCIFFHQSPVSIHLSMVAPLIWEDMMCGYHILVVVIPACGLDLVLLVWLQVKQAIITCLATQLVIPVARHHRGGERGGGEASPSSTGLGQQRASGDPGTGCHQHLHQSMASAALDYACTLLHFSLCSHGVTSRLKKSWTGSKRLHSCSPSTMLCHAQSRLAWSFFLQQHLVNESSFLDLITRVLQVQAGPAIIIIQEK